MIINIRGTNASGKSTTVHGLMAHFGVAEKLERRGKTWGYRLHGGHLVVGDYESGFGGTENQKFSDIGDSVLELAQRGDVVFEGFLFSTVFKASDEFARRAKAQDHRVVFGLMSTPVALCVERAQERRLSNGNTGPVPASRIATKHQECIKSWRRLSTVGHDCRLLPHEDALATLLRWLPEVQPAGEQR
jgi:hypothetical protein